jgi:hypothetical protein
MPRIFDNIELPLLPALQETLPISQRSDFCVGYFNLRGWRMIDTYLDHFTGNEDSVCRVLVGMQRLTHDDMHTLYSLVDGEPVSQGQSEAFKKKMAEDFREQLAAGAPTNEDEQGLRRLAAQIRAKKVVVKLFFRHTLHAKLYLLYRHDPNNPIVGFLGSSNLTLAGLSKQGELNVDVLDHDACNKLEKWFNDRWNDRFVVDISEMLATVIETSWARETQIPPYHIYLKIAYHLSQDAIAGLNEFAVPSDFLQNPHQKLFKFQSIAVQIAARYLYKRNGVLIGDVVGLGKTLMATALCRIFQDDYNTETLIICPKNLKNMWQHYKHTYRLVCDIISTSEIDNDFVKRTPRYRVVLIDESHNFRNREGMRYKAIQEYIGKNDSRCILLSATPYNKTYLDLSGQLRLFITDDHDLGVRPEKKIKELGEIEFERQHQCKPHSIAAFEKSEHADDWRELMRLYLIRRTRSFIMDFYTEEDESNGRKYLELADGTRSFFPARIPKTIKFKVDEDNKADPYARLFAGDVVDVINHLELPRYGLGNYVAPRPKNNPTPAEARTLAGLSRAGKRLMGFCRTNLFKRLESGGPTFIQSVERHILRNFVFVHALENKLEIPLGTQDSEMLDSRINDIDDNSVCSLLLDTEDTGNDECSEETLRLRAEPDFRKRAQEVYKDYLAHFRNRFKWLRSDLFIGDLKENLLTDARSLITILAGFGEWKQEQDAKLNSLHDLLTKKHAKDKVLVFTQFADTVEYLSTALKARGIERIEGVTGAAENPTKSVWRFSPVSNEKSKPSAPDYVSPSEELRVLITTDVLSEGQNLQDCFVVVNYDLPWAIIRLIQRAGRVDRIGQQSEKIWCYSFLPAEGIERIINLRTRVRQRLHENAEVVGADESFFEDFDEQKILNLYHEKSGILDDEKDNDVDPSSYAYQIWKNAIDKDPSLKRTIEDLPNVVYSAKEHLPLSTKPAGALVYMRTAEGNDSLAWVDQQGAIASESGLAILEAAKCEPSTPPVPRHEKHHEFVAAAAKHVLATEKIVGGGLGSPRGARFRIYERMKEYLRNIAAKRDLFISDEFIKSLELVVDDIYRSRLRSSAVDALNRVLKSGINDYDLANMVIRFREEERLTDKADQSKSHSAQIICSMGLVGTSQGVS